MHQHPANIAATPDLNNGSTNLTARPVTIVHDDGTTETVYLMQVPVGKKFKDHIQEHVVLGYLIIGTLALTLSVILSYRQLKNGNG